MKIFLSFLAFVLLSLPHPSFSQAMTYEEANPLLTPAKVRDLLFKTQIALKSKDKKVIKNFFKDSGEKSLKVILNVNPPVVEQLNIAEKYTLSEKNIEGLNVFHAFFNGKLEEDKQVIARDNRSAAGRFIINSPLIKQKKIYFQISLNCGYQLKYDKEYVARFFTLECRASEPSPDT